MIEVLAIIVPVFGLIALGFAAARSELVHPEGVAALQFFRRYVAQPAFIFQLVGVSAVPWGSLLSFAVTATFATYCAFAIAFSVAAFISRGQMPEATVEGLAGSASDIPAMGPALAVAAFGAAAAAPMALVLAVDGAMLAVMTPLMMALGGSARSSPGALAEEIGRGVLLNPLFLATVAGFLAAAVGFRFPVPLDALLTLLAQATPAVALFALGADLPFRPIQTFQAEVPLLLVVKLIAHPLIVYLLLNWVGGFDPVWVETAVLMAALPPTVSILNVAKAHGVASDRVATAILLATVISVATVTIVLVLLQSGTLPIHAAR